MTELNAFASDSRPTLRTSGVRRVDRLWDLAALVFVFGGLALFLLARRALGALGAGSYHLPKGVSYVARADLHLAQVRMAVWLIGTGVLVGIVSAARHKLRDR